MTTREAIEELSKRGNSTTYWVLRGMICREEIPRPRMNSSLQWDWTTEDLDNVQQALERRSS